MPYISLAKAALRLLRFGILANSLTSHPKFRLFIEKYSVNVIASFKLQGVL
ncbi:hypothetical protein PPEP_a3736 [Pseudoalteromonas peptidolytica F12-50-A1]|uniref:Uncharacterized protein n=1 Tax=Pseudoalteromonas peptidolytica F12-50-A1 TaxID=1315280 RepID=A0A8I0MW63_9GAMM|nr:hypothetical protein [Pseudoalteromonas peptidolytica F12-50-A1]